MSSPNMNTLISIGCSLAYISVILRGINGSILKEPLNIMCNLSTWSLSLAFTLSFGSLFSKTWRVYVIFTNKAVKRKAIKDIHLVGIVVCLLFLDVLFLSLWAGLDPQKVRRRDLLKEYDENTDVLRIPYIYTCEARHKAYWLTAIYSSKGLLLMFGIFFAWQTRKVTLVALNDSKEIGLCVYNVMVMAAVGVPVVNFMDSEQVDILYGLEATCIILCTTVTLLLVFASKMYSIYQYGDHMTGNRRVVPSDDNQKPGPSNSSAAGNVDHLKCKVEMIKLNDRIQKLQVALNRAGFQDAAIAFKNDDIETIEDIATVDLVENVPPGVLWTNVESINSKTLANPVTE
ncbi:unnamed protein product [Owenia fusiformis]|uniref:Uncharacterized protein n=1 Tax=Owenia fusiformis TaxID=6347 RepID=A0A8J1UKP1_OWEFU|nr:unnamed protein product [Owenia fusiformis]